MREPTPATEETSSETSNAPTSPAFDISNMREPGVPRVIGCRVDALTIAYRVELEEARSPTSSSSPPSSTPDEKKPVEKKKKRSAMEVIRERSAVASQTGGTAELAIGSFVGAIKRPKTKGAERWPVRNADLRGMIEPHATGGWNVEITLHAAYLAQHTFADAVKLCHEIAASFGTVKGKRTRRLDLCADLIDYDMRPGDEDAFRTPRRGKFDKFNPSKHVKDRSKDDFAPWDEESERPHVRTYYNSGIKITGWAICPGNDASARIYSKTTELDLPQSEHKKEIEHAIWTRNGWNGSDEVTRAEFQLRGTVLDEMELRDPDELEKNLDAIWAYMTSRIVKQGSTWFRMIQPDSATRSSRCALDDRWRVVQSVTFTHQSDPIRRRRVRGGASWPQTFGSLLSSLAAAGNLGRVDLSAFRTELAIEQSKGQEAQPHDMARAWGLSLLLDVAVTGAIRAHEWWFGAENHVSDQEQDVDRPNGTKTPGDVAALLAEKFNATWARFRSSDDPWTFPPHYHVEVDPLGDFRVRLVVSSGVPPPLDDPYDDAERNALGDA